MVAQVVVNPSMPYDHDHDDPQGYQFNTTKMSTGHHGKCFQQNGNRDIRGWIFSGFLYIYRMQPVPVQCVLDTT